MNWIGGHGEAEELSPEHHARPSDHDSDVGLPPGGKKKIIRELEVGDRFVVRRHKV